MLWGGRRIPSRVDPAGEGDDCVCCARSTAGDRQFSWEDAPDEQGPHDSAVRGEGAGTAAGEMTMGPMRHTQHESAARAGPQE